MTDEHVDKKPKIEQEHIHNKSKGRRSRIHEQSITLILLETCPYRFHQMRAREIGGRFERHVQAKVVRENLLKLEKVAVKFDVLNRQTNHATTMAFDAQGVLLAVARAQGQIQVFDFDDYAAAATRARNKQNHEEGKAECIHPVSL